MSGSPPPSSRLSHKAHINVPSQLSFAISAGMQKSGSTLLHEYGWSSGDARWFDLTNKAQDPARLAPESLLEFLEGLR